MRKAIWGAIVTAALAGQAAAAVAGQAPAADTPIRPDQAAFRALYEELVETTPPCPKAAARSPRSGWRRGSGPRG